MFFEGEVSNKKGSESERFVWERVKEEFQSRIAFGFLNFPMFKDSHQGRKEIDILLVDKGFGVTVIEVKGISIKQIKHITGGVWHCEGADGPFKISPYTQAEEQLDMLCNDIEKEPLLFRSFTKRVVIALPYITRDQWESRGYSSLLNSPPVLLKEDFMEQGWAQRLESMYLVKAKQDMNERHWDRLNRYFGIDKMAQDDKGFLAEEQDNFFSYTFLLKDDTDFYRQMPRIISALEKGKKVYLFTGFDLPISFREDNHEYIKNFQLQHFVSRGFTSSGMIGSYIDGKIERNFLVDVLARWFPDFNPGQYETVHAGPEEDLKIMAGAGTGKTHVMIDRIMYLLETTDITPKDIVMITFTNSSTDEMRERLLNKMLSMFELTGDSKYLRLLEEVRDMQISTIHAYSKSILTRLAHEIGLGRDVRISSFIMRKKVIVEELADEFFTVHPLKPLINLGLSHYEAVNLMIKYWDEMEKKGLTREEIESLDWGSVADEGHIMLQDLFRYVFAQCEARLDAVKRTENAIDMGDMIRKLRIFTTRGAVNQLLPNKYLFVDEFQDSDNTQIELVATLRNELNYRLFVVGDVKQSIYRFRGADYTSFERLDSLVASPLRSLSLNQNYRTSASLLDKMGRMFAAWGEHSEKLLPYTDLDRLVGVESTGMVDQELVIDKVKRKDLNGKIIEKVEQALAEVRRLSAKENRKVALIVRTNRHAKDVARICEEAGLAVTQNLDGTFFKSDAVRHFKMLLDALLYPHEMKNAIGLLESPYFAYEIPSRTLVGFQGDSERLDTFISSHIGNDLSGYVRDLRLSPVLSVIQKVITEKGLRDNILPYYLHREAESTVAEMRAAQYGLNLSHLMNMLQQRFDASTGTLWAIHQWLSLQIRVNRSENEPMVDDVPDRIEVTTVHRSKGLEYHTVIMPKMNYCFKVNRTGFYIEEDKGVQSEGRKVGWKLKHTSNSYLKTLESSEGVESKREETRLLYVSMTRAKRRLVVLLPKKFEADSWAGLVDMAMKGVLDED